MPQSGSSHTLARLLDLACIDVDGFMDFDDRCLAPYAHILQIGGGQ